MKKIDIDKLGEPVSKKRLHFDGDTKDYPTYRIPITLLHYNIQNGRIAASMPDKRRSDLLEVLGDDSSDDNRKKFNDAIRPLILCDANGKLLDTSTKTKEDIRKKGQMEAGVILDDGTVIDGNRRFSLLCELFQSYTKSEPSSAKKYAFFEAVVLPTPAENESEKWTEIAKLEIQVQLNNDPIVDYDPVDKMANLYRSVLNGQTRRLTEEE